MPYRYRCDNCDMAYPIRDTDGEADDDQHRHWDRHPRCKRVGEVIEVDSDGTPADSCLIALILPCALLLAFLPRAVRAWRR
ncbi:hypothetical protein [Streptomyces sp. NPDC058157]|uniref:hypothetical protein n=1 Tax=Streptomyces sp. NPDC058157 TaxID=3346360 RepID=UPI0036ED6167